MLDSISCLASVACPQRKKFRDPHRSIGQHTDGWCFVRKRSEHSRRKKTQIYDHNIDGAHSIAPFVYIAVLPVPTEFPAICSKPYSGRRGHHCRNLPVLLRSLRGSSIFLHLGINLTLPSCSVRESVWNRNTNVTHLSNLSSKLPGICIQRRECGPWPRSSSISNARYYHRA